MNHSNFPSGFEGFQCRLEAMVEALGGHNFVRIAVAQDMADGLRHIVDSRLGGYDATRGLTFAEYLLATASEFDAAAAAVERMVYREHEEPADAISAPIHGGAFALRDTRLWFETDRAALLMAHAYPDNGHTRRSGKERWSVSVTDDAKAFFHHAGGKEPSLSSTGAGSRDGAIKSLRRLAEAAFRAPLTDTTPATADAA